LFTSNEELEEQSMNAVKIIALGGKYNPGPACGRAFVSPRDLGRIGQPQPLATRIGDCEAGAASETQ
jgi:hypothetical protein